MAIVSDIHGNRTGLNAVLSGLRKTAPDLIFHGGDLPHGGASPAEVIDQICDLGWPGVLGNTDEMLFNPKSLTDFAAQSPHLKSLFAAIEEMAAATRDALGEHRLAWLKTLPLIQIQAPLALVHATPYPSTVHPHCIWNDPSEHRQRQSFLRWRSPRGLSPIGQRNPYHPASGIRHRQRTQSTLRMRTSACRMDGKKFSPAPARKCLSSYRFPTA